MPSYFSADLGSAAVLTGSSTNGSPSSQRPLPSTSVNVSPHTPLAVIGPSQSGLAPQGLRLTAATPTSRAPVGAVVGLSVAVAVGTPVSVAVGVALDVAVAALVAVTVGATVAVTVGALVAVTVAARVGFALGALVAVATGIAVTVEVGGAPDVGVAVGWLSLESLPHAASAASATNSSDRAIRTNRDMVHPPRKRCRRYKLDSRYDRGSG